jgi:hypothetical protein
VVKQTVRITYDKEGGSIKALPIKCAFMLLLSAVTAAFTTPSSYAGGLSTVFSKVIVEGLEAGRSYNVEEISKVPLEVMNTSNRKVQLKIDVMIPKEEDLSDGYVPVPDASWLTLEASYFEIEPGASARTGLHINIPAGEKYNGKKYAVYIWSHTVGESLGVGLMSKLLFTTINKKGAVI